MPTAYEPRFHFLMIQIRMLAYNVTRNQSCVNLPHPMPRGFEKYWRYLNGVIWLKTVRGQRNFLENMCTSVVNSVVVDVLTPLDARISAGLKCSGYGSVIWSP